MFRADLMEDRGVRSWQTWPVEEEEEEEEEGEEVSSLVCACRLLDVPGLILQRY